MNEITAGHFTTEAQALAEIEAMGWHALARDVVIARDEELHWHDGFNISPSEFSRPLNKPAALRR